MPFRSILRYPDPRLRQKALCVESFSSTTRQLLEDLAKSVKAGTVCLQKGGEFVTLKPCGSLEFQVEAGVKKSKQKLSLSVKWEDPCELAAPEEIKIGSKEPEIAVAEPAPSGDPLAVEVAPELAGGVLGMNEAK